jgi:hypothetical protein
MREHGEYACYVWGPLPGQGKGCRCGPCGAANSAYEARRKRLRAYGLEAFASVEETDKVRRKVRELQARGVGYKRVADAAGVSASSLYKMLAGRERMTHKTAQAILHLDDVPLADHALVDATLFWQRVQALQDQGWSKAWIARQLLGDPNATALQAGPERVTYLKHRLMATLYARFRNLPAPPRGTRPQCCGDCRWEPGNWWCLTCGYGPHRLCA